MNTTEHQYVVIMAGGIGSRFWPYSRASHPKQFHDILGTGRTMLQQTADRFEGICPHENIFVVTNEDYYQLVKEQLPFLSDEQILLEPVMRNTAPCIAYASYKIYSKDPDANLVISPADHVILNPEQFKKDIQQVLSVTEKHNVLATLGISPTRPDTGYGYIQANNEETLSSLFKVKTFTEKPNLELAQAFLDSGDFVWNAGIFVWKAKTIIGYFEKLLPEIAGPFQELTPHYYTETEKEHMQRAYYQCRNISIDYGIMEHADQVYVLPGDFGWSDLGTWKSLYEQSEKDQNQNAFLGDVMAYDTKNCIVKTPKERLVVIQGLDNFIVAEHDNVLLICHKDQEQQVKKMLADVKESRGENGYC